MRRHFCRLYACVSMWFYVCVPCVYGFLYAYPCVYQCICVCMHFCVFVCMCLHVCRDAYVYACISGCLHECVYRCICVHAFLYLCMHVCQDAYVHMHFCMFVCMCFHVVLCVPPCMLRFVPAFMSCMYVSPSICVCMLGYCSVHVFNDAPATTSHCYIARTQCFNCSLIPHPHTHNEHPLSQPPAPRHVYASRFIHILVHTAITHYHINTCVR